jgi:hypothetical protein
MHTLTACVKGCQDKSELDKPPCATNRLSMALTSKEFRRRVLAAGALHGAGMREIRDLLQDFGTERTLAEAVISGKKPQNKRNIRDLAEAFEVPREWFTEPDWRDLIPGSGEESRDQSLGRLDADEDEILPGDPTSPPTEEQEPGTGIG